LFGVHLSGRRSVAKNATALKDVRERMASGFDGKPLTYARWYGHIEILDIGGYALYRPRLTPEVSANDTCASSIVIDDYWNVARRDVLIPRIGHFQRRWEICPELKPMHAAARIALWHFLVKDASSSGHPLDVARAELASVTQTVTVLDGTCQDIGDGLYATVGMPGEPRYVVLGVIPAEIIKQ
jgi:hypothetical protein